MITPRDTRSNLRQRLTTVPTGTIPRTMRVGLVLGAGGIQGGAWLTGGLSALATETGWDPMEATRIVGTSAGSMIGSIVAAGTPDLVHGRPLRGRDHRGPHRLRRAAPPPMPTARREPPSGSPRPGRPSAPAHGRSHCARLASRSSTRPRRSLPAGFPRGFISTEPLKDIVRRCLRRRLEPSPRHAGCRLRLRHRAPHRLRPAHVAEGRPRGRGRRILRDSRLLPPRLDRRQALRGRGHVLDLEPRHPSRRPHGPRHLPQPDLVPPPHPRIQPARVGRPGGPRRIGPAPRHRGAHDARTGAPASS